MVSSFCLSKLARASCSSASTFFLPSAIFCSTSACVSFFIAFSAAAISARAAAITAFAFSSSCLTSSDVSFTLFSFSLIAASLSSMNFPSGVNHILSSATIRNRNSTIIMGRVRLKSNSAAFSISLAREG
ncbi:hypothetical protein V8G54_007708 [Vigna mungo]|uniref:Uncharacterized protein n=1 Tax=Vigna mungo TaxID=3915 RepID=A0AAQ3S973_VIGMU